MRVLLLERNDVLAGFFTKALKNAGYAVNWVNDDDKARNALSEARVDVIICSFATEGGQASSVNWSSRLADLRRYGYHVPLVGLVPQSASATVEGMTEKPDSLLLSPCLMSDLLATVNDLVARTSSPEGGVVHFGDVELDVRYIHLKEGDRMLPLTRKEAVLLESLMRRPGVVVERHVIEQALYGNTRRVGPNALEVLVSRLRKKLISGNISAHLLTVRGAGYMLVEGEKK